MSAGMFVRFNVFVLSLVAALHAFDVRHLWVRMHSSVQHDSLIHYNMLLTWLRHGDSPRGITLTPSPYFVDMLVQLPLLLLAPDFERFSYALAAAYAILIFASLYAVLRIVLDASKGLAAVVAGLAVIGFYKLAPFNLLVHTFVFNHTSEIFTTLGLLALVHVWFRPGAPRRRYAAPVYVLLLAICVASSPFFIATYCIPAAVASAALLGTEYASWRRLVWFNVLGVVGALAGLIALAIISRYFWTLRVDTYGRWWKAYQAFKQTIRTDPELMRIAWATVIAMVLSIALVVVGRRKQWCSLPAIFMLAFFPVCVASCIVLPIKRGGFSGAYELRYLTLPWLLMLAFYVAVAARLATAVAARALENLSQHRVPRWITSASVLLGAAAIGWGSTCRGGLSMYESASFTAPMIQCVRDAERRGGLEDGVATWWTARYLNAARHAADWQSPYVIVQITGNDPPQLDPRDNNLLWFDGRYRGGNHTLNFVSTHSLSDDVLAYYRTHLGPPDRTVTCPVAHNLRPDRKDTFDLWIYDRAEAQRALTDMVMGDNLRSPFAAGVDTPSMQFDVLWGMIADLQDGELVGGHRIWRRGVHVDAGWLATTNYMYLPSGRYRLDVALTAVAARTRPGPVAELLVRPTNGRELVRVPIAAGAPATLEIDLENRGGATSGEMFSFTVAAGTGAETIDLSGMKLTLLEQRGFSPFRIFK